MSIKNRLFTYSTTPISGASQSGNLIISSNYIDGYTWWGGPDENTGYVIAHTDTNPNIRTERNKAAIIPVNSVGFWRTGTKSDNEFLSMFNGLFNQSYGSASVAAYWLGTNGYWTSYTPEQPLISPILVGGSFTTYNSDSYNRIVSISDNGVVDNTFTIGTGFDADFVTVITRSTSGLPITDGVTDPLTSGFGTGFNSTVRTIDKFSDGSMLAGGSFTTFQGLTRNIIAKINSDGTDNSAFYSNLGSGFNGGDVIKVLILNDDSILVGGSFTTINGNTRNYICKLNSDGTLDTSFNLNLGTITPGSINTIVKTPDGNYAIGGRFDGVNGNLSYSDLVKIDQNGNLITSFVPQAPNYTRGIITIAVQPDGKIVVYGYLQNNLPEINRVMRYNADGTFDNSFNSNLGNNILSGGADFGSVLLYPDGKILILGGILGTISSFTLNGILRLNSDGTPDSAFMTQIGTGLSVSAFTAAGGFIQEDNKIVIGGYFNLFNGAGCSNLIRLFDDGSRDFQFTIPGVQATNYAISTLLEYSNSLVVIGGDFTQFNETTVGRIAAYYRPTDDRILVGGRFTTYNNTTANRIIRLNTDGSIDNAFIYGSGFGTSPSHEIKTIKIQTDGKILVGGHFTSYNGTTRNNIIRLNSDGTIDNTFTVGTGFNDSPFNILLQSSGKIVIGGPFTTYNGSTANRIIRLNTDGSVDNTFTIGTGFNNLTLSCELQSDDKIIVSGLFTSYNGTSYTGLIRLNSNGTIDNTFTVGTGLNTYALCIRIQFDGKILLGGAFTTYKGITANRIIRLNSDGSVDNTFTIGTGFNNTVESIFIQSNGKILIGGAFSSYNGDGSGLYGLIRLNIDGTVDRKYSFNSNVKFVI
jgi:uncharacterized delta-60 repeat protein